MGTPSELGSGAQTSVLSALASISSAGGALVSTAAAKNVLNGLSGIAAAVKRGSSGPAPPAPAAPSGGNSTGQPPPPPPSYSALLDVAGALVGSLAQGQTVAGEAAAILNSTDGDVQARRKLSSQHGA